MSQVAPGWDTLEVHLTARGQRWDVGVVDRRGGAEHGRWVVPVEPGSPLEADAAVLRETAYRHPAGTWFSAVVTLTATGWPDARVGLGTAFNHDDEPDYLLADQPRLTAQDLLEDWVRFPRTREATPGWVLARVEAAGLRLPFVPAGSGNGLATAGLVPASAADVPTREPATATVPAPAPTSTRTAPPAGPPAVPTRRHWRRRHRTRPTPPRPAPPTSPARRLTPRLPDARPCRRHHTRPTSPARTPRATPPPVPA